MPFPERLVRVLHGAAGVGRYRGVPMPVRQFNRPPLDQLDAEGAVELGLSDLLVPVALVPVVFVGVERCWAVGQPGLTDGRA